MLKFEIKIALRKLLKSKLYTSVNVLGLAVGLSACLVMATIVLDDLSYDKQWKQSNQLFKIIGVTNVNHGVEETPQVFSGLAPELKRTFPEVKAFCRMEVEEAKIKFGEEKEVVNIHSLLAENSIWDLLDFTIVEGNPKAIKEGIDNVVITQQLKDEYYKNDNPVGKIIYQISKGSTTKYIITGVIKDIPNNTHLRSQIIVLRSYLRDANAAYNKFSNGESPALMPQYLLLDANTNPTEFESKLNAWYKKQSSGVLSNNSFYLQSIKNVYLRSNYYEPAGVHASIKAEYIYAAIAALILLIACINYVNLSTARAIERMKEAAVSKVVGADRGHIVLRFLLEATMFFLMAFIIALGAYSWALRFVETYLAHPLTVTVFNSVTLFCLSVFTLLFVCVTTALYPAFMLSAIKPVYALKGIINNNIGKDIFKKVLIITQFAIALMVLIASITINLQFRYLKNADPGYDKNNLLQIGFINWGTSGEAFKKELLQIPGVESASIAGWYPTFGPGTMVINGKDPRNENEVLHIAFIQCDFDFPTTLKLHLKSGRFFDASRPADATDPLGRQYSKVLVSDSYVDIFKVSQLDKPIEDFRHIPIGVIQGFHNESFLEKANPFIISAYKNNNYGGMLIRVTPGAENHVVASLRQIWKRYYTAQNLSYNRVEDLLAAQYRNESKLSNIFNIFTLLAVALACLGLFGVVTFTLEKRMKEIGIRKILGASVGAISTMISKDFLKLVFLAMVIASPVAWYFLNRWLQYYPYRINVYWWIFVLAALLMLIITIATLSVKTVKVALANPVKSLRSE